MLTQKPFITHSQIHAGNPFKFDDRPRRDIQDTQYINPAGATCTFCGSVNIDAFINTFKTPGNSFSGSDWKYGWPHKFYLEIKFPEPILLCKGSTYKDGVSTFHEPVLSHVEHNKFYNEHLYLATPEQLEQYNIFVYPFTGIRFELKEEKGEKRIYFSAPRHGYQAYGEITEKNIIKVN
jgi:hypothetical protein